MMRLALSLAAPLALSPPQGAALARMTAPPPQQASAPAGPTQCAFGAWQTWEGGRVNVMNAPDEGTHILGTLPAPDRARDYPVYLDLIGTAPGWLHIARASDIQNEQAGRPRRAVYAGEGWVRPGVVKLGIQSARGYLRADAALPRIVHLGDKWLTEVAKVAEIRGCIGDWVLVAYRTETDARDVPTGGTA